MRTKLEIRIDVQKLCAVNLQARSTSKVDLPCDGPYDYCYRCDSQGTLAGRLPTEWSLDLVRSPPSMQNREVNPHPRLRHSMRRKFFSYHKSVLVNRHHYLALEDCIIRTSEGPSDTVPIVLVDI